MRKLIMQLEITLDGFGSGPNGEFDWFTLDTEAWKLRNEAYLSQIDTVVLGRKNYQGFYGYWPPVATNPEASETDVGFSRWLDAIPKLVVSKTLTKTEWQNSRLVQGDLTQEVSRLKEESGKDILIMSSTSVAQTCMAAGLIDDYWLTVHPVALGSGVPLFKERVDLKLLDSRVFPSGQVFLHYETRRT